MVGKIIERKDLIDGLSIKKNRDNKIIYMYYKSGREDHFDNWANLEIVGNTIKLKESAPKGWATATLSIDVDKIDKIGFYSKWI